MAIREEQQLGFDERVIEDADVEHALQARQAAKLELTEARSEFDEQHKKAMAAIERLELPEGGIARVGNFRISRKFVKGGMRSFETKDRSQVSISLVGEE